MLINPGAHEEGVPHYGLGMLATILKHAGYGKVDVLDYALSMKIPSLDSFLRQNTPTAILISVFSCRARMVEEMVRLCRSCHPQAPVILGGPHISCYGDEMPRPITADHLVQGESESVIVDLVSRERVRERPVVSQGIPCDDLDALPLPDYSLFLSHESMAVYPLMTSRGCPYECSFCAVKVTNSKKWRPRSIEGCVAELEAVQRNYPQVREVVIWDDNFSLRIERAKALFGEFLNRAFRFKLSAANVRADKVDVELLRLMKKAGGNVLQLGVEHGDPEIFDRIGKGETHEAIYKAAADAHGLGMEVRASFIIGLPGDSIKKTLASVRMARKLGASRVYWNILVPYRGSRVYEYFHQRGWIADDRIPQTLPGSSNGPQINAATPWFPADEMARAYRTARVLTEEESLRPCLPSLLGGAFKYRYTLELSRLMARKVARRAGRMVERARKMFRG